MVRLVGLVLVLIMWLGWRLWRRRPRTTAMAAGRRRAWVLAPILLGIMWGAAVRIQRAAARETRREQLQALTSLSVREQRLEETKALDSAQHVVDAALSRAHGGEWPAFKAHLTADALAKVERLRQRGQPHPLALWEPAGAKLLGFKVLGGTMLSPAMAVVRTQETTRHKSRGESTSDYEYLLFHDEGGWRISRRRPGLHNFDGDPTGGPARASALVEGRLLQALAAAVRLPSGVPDSAMQEGGTLYASVDLQGRVTWSLPDEWSNPRVRDALGAAARKVTRVSLRDTGLDAEMLADGDALEVSVWVTPSTMRGGS